MGVHDNDCATLMRSAAVDDELRRWRRASVLAVVLAVVTGTFALTVVPPLYEYTVFVHDKLQRETMQCVVRARPASNSNHTQNDAFDLETTLQETMAAHDYVRVVERSRRSTPGDGGDLGDMSRRWLEYYKSRFPDKFKVCAVRRHLR